MAKTKYKLTGCARFFIFMVIFVPAVVIGVSYYQGTNPVQMVKGLIGMDGSTTKTEQPANDRPNRNKSETKELQKEIDALQDELKIKDQIIENLEKRLADSK